MHFKLLLDRHSLDDFHIANWMMLLWKTEINELTMLHRLIFSQIDPRHRYGHNLEFYYGVWCDCDSKQPFFYW